MIEIIEQIGSPVRLPAYREFLPGHIVKLVRTPTSVYCGLSNSTNPFGIVTGPIEEFELIPILCGTASIINTDNFDSNGEYKEGEFVYSNNSGVITSLKLHGNSVPIAYVERELEEGCSILQIRWI